ncbi:hypothetical protein EMM73_05660 [Rheinheimera sediminis]|uniref:hypothetical protein n=1 Tax=Rheinheimera sp. YQF-1 TaxID=2499626 RepID=UPI000FDA14A1|nr:hypothetical protein [Rheinheimera sp. YQF-1]RVT47385.1 hypothetical protein EMM73_05660 [Rheinheimera sp. YQF-1]
MSITRRGKILKLSGAIGVEDAEIIYAQYEQQLFTKVDLQQCDHLHSTVFQLLVVFQIPIYKYPQKPELASWFVHSASVYTSQQEA